jgi:outer membrane receptor protein involved in Fe transport
VVTGVLRTFLAPNHQFSAVVTQHIGQRFIATFGLTASSNYLAPIFGTSSRAYRFDGIKKADVTLSYRLPLAEFKAVRFFAKADNVFNQSYYESGFLTPGATGVGGLQFEF